MNGDQRKRHRLALRLPLLLSRLNSEQHPIATETLNISTDGFYCTTPEPFAPGERLRCLISLRDDLRVPGEAQMYLDADVEVVRIVARNTESGFGYGCRILDYRLSSAEPKITVLS